MPVTERLVICNRHAAAAVRDIGQCNEKSSASSSFCFLSLVLLKAGQATWFFALSEFFDCRCFVDWRTFSAQNLSTLVFVTCFHTNGSFSLFISDVYFCAKIGDFFTASMCKSHCVPQKPSLLLLLTAHVEVQGALRHSLRWLASVACTTKCILAAEQSQCFRMSVHLEDNLLPNTGDS